MAVINWSLSKLLMCFCVCVGKINVMNFFVKGDNLSLCLYRVIGTFYLRIPCNPSTPRDSWRLGGLSMSSPKSYPQDLDEDLAVDCSLLDDCVERLWALSLPCCSDWCWMSFLYFSSSSFFLRCSASCFLLNWSMLSSTNFFNWANVVLACSAHRCRFLILHISSVRASWHSHSFSTRNLV